ITAIPLLLDLLDLQDRIVTIDAMGCQTEIAAQVVAGGGDYVLAVKDNQPRLHAEVRQAFETALDCEDPRLRWHATEETGHGRQERRVVWVLPADRHVSARADWVGLCSLVLVLRVVTCQVSGVQTVELHHYMSSLRPNARRLAGVIRGHWGIENGLH